MILHAAGAVRHVILVVGGELAPGVARKLAVAGFTICSVRNPEAARVFLGDRIPVAILLGPSNGTDPLALVRWVRKQERLAFVQVFASSACTSVTTAICAGADDVFEVADDDSADRIAARIHRAQSLAQLALLDPLTHLHNRRFMNDRLEAEVSRAARSNAIFSIAMVDLDDFKKINDTFGHAAGDRALAAFRRSLRRDLRAYDVPCRFGGDEFVVLFPDCDAAGAHAALAKLRRNGGWFVPGLPAVTFSAGIAQFPDDGDSWAALFDVADRNTLFAKKGGRNRTIGGV